MKTLGDLMNDALRQRQALVPPPVLKTMSEVVRAEIMSGVIRAEIEKEGAISFYRFMEIALYHPDIGYYEHDRDVVGRGGDFVTNVSTGSLFGELLAFQFAEWLEELPEPKYPVAMRKIVEAGAHDGKLAFDILSWLQKHHPDLFDTFEYHILETSKVRRYWQERTLGKQFNGKVFWTHTASSFKGWLDVSTSEPNLTGIIFSNELLDALPVTRFGWDASAMRWFEWGVAWASEKFAWTKLELRAGDRRIPQLPESLLAALPDGYILDRNFCADGWWRDMASTLRRGKLLTIDYGCTAEDLISPARVKGTLRAYHRHQVSDDLLAQPGEQDLTAHVNFTAIQQAGEAAGLQTEGLIAQSKFLTAIAGRIWKNPAIFGAWTPGHTRQFQTLTHPEHLGRAFRVLVQSR